MNIVNTFPLDVKKGQMVCLDIETYRQPEYKIHRPTGEFACLSVAVEGHDNVYQIYDKHDVRKMLEAVGKGTWVFHRSLYDLTQLRRFASIKPRFIWDTLLVERGTYAGLYLTYSLKDLARRYLGVIMEKEVRGDFSTAYEMTPEMKTYAAKDAELDLNIAIIQREQLEGTRQFRGYMEIDEPVIWPVLDMQGIRVDVSAWEEMVKGFQRRFDELQDECGINVRSSQQVIKAAKEIAHLHLRNTRKETLASYSDVPFIAKVLEARMYGKAVSTYGLKWLERYVEDDGKVYASYNINGTETTRFTCTDPNMQQIPARKLPVYRTRFIPSIGHLMMVSDVSQQEPRILAYESQDDELIKAFNLREDIHLYVARAVFHDDKMVKEDPRRKTGKDINLGTSYGLTSFGLARRTDLSEQEAEGFIRNYFNRFRGVHNWISIKRQFAYQHGYVETVTGRRLYINPYSRQWENNAINNPIQGGAAEFSKMWTYKYWKNCKDRGLYYALCGMVHDENVLDYKRGTTRETKKALLDGFQETAETLFPDVPFEEETATGRSWACKDMKEEAMEDDDEI